MHTFLTANPGTDLKTADLFSADALAQYTWPQDADPKALLQQLRIRQRLLKTYNNNDVAAALEALGMHSAHHIASLGEPAFTAQALPQLAALDSVADPAAVCAAIYAHAVRIQRASFEAALARPRSLQLDMTQPAADSVNPDFQEGIPDYERLFGPMVTCDCDDCQTIFGPAAYFTDLMRVVTQYVNQPLEPLFTLQYRRPDLWTLPLDGAAANTALSYLDIVNAILQQNLQTNYTGGANPLHTAASMVYPFAAPFNADLSAVQAGMQQLDADLGALYELLEVPAPATAVQALHLSPEQYAIITGSENSSVSELYGFRDKGISDADLCSRLSVQEIFLRQTGLQPAQLEALVYQDMKQGSSGSELNPVLMSSLFLNNIIGNGQYIRLKDSSADTVNKHFSPASLCITTGAVNAELHLADTPLNDVALQQLAAYIRLQAQTGWSFEELDWAIRSVAGTQKTINQQIIESLSQIAVLKKKYGIAIDELCSFWYDIKTYGRGNDAAPQDLWDRVYNTPPMLAGNNDAGDPYYRPQYNSDSDGYNNPLFQSPVLSWTFDNAGHSQDQRTGNTLAASLGISATDLSAILDAVLPDGVASCQLTLGLMSQLYRIARMAKMLGMRVPDFIAFSAVAGLALSAAKTRWTITDVIILADQAAWLKKSGLSVSQLSYLTSGAIPAATTGVPDADKISKAIQSMNAAAAPVRVTPETFVSGQVDAAAAQAIYRQLIAAGYINSDGVVLNVHELTQGNIYTALTTDADVSASVFGGIGIRNYVSFSAASGDTAQFNFDPFADAVIQASNCFTMSMWVKSNVTLSEGWPRLAGNAQQDGGNAQKSPSVTQVQNKDTAVQVSYGYGNHYYAADANVFLTAGEWVFLSWVNHNGVWRLYRNGVPVSLDMSDAPPAGIFRQTVTNPTYFLASSFSGAICNVAIWNTAHTADQVAEDMAAYSYAEATDLVAWWPINEGSGTVLHSGMNISAQEGILSDTCTWGATKDVAVNTASTAICNTLKQMQQAQLAFITKSLNGQLGVSTETMNGICQLSSMEVNNATAFGVAAAPVAYAANMLLTDAAANPNINDYLAVLGFNTALAKWLKLSGAELNSIAAYSKAFGNTDFGFGKYVFTITQLMTLSDYKALQRLCNQPDGLIPYFVSGAKNQSNIPANEQLVLLSQLTGWDLDEITAVVNQPYFASVNFNTVTGLRKLADVMAFESRMGTDIVTLNLLRSLYELNLFAPAPANYWQIYSDAAAAVMAMLGNKKGQAAINQVYGALAERKRNVFCDWLIWALDAAISGVSNTQQLYEYLLIDVNMSAGVQTSRMVAAMNSLQLYVNRVINRLEPGVTNKIPEAWWEWMSTYRVWQANREVYLYPENYVDPGLRKFQSSQFKQFINDISKGQINDENVKQALGNYLQSVAAIASLELTGGTVTSLPDRITGTSAADHSRAMFLTAKTRSQPHTFYTRSVLVTTSDAGVQNGSDVADASDIHFGGWEEINLHITADDISTIVAFGRQFIFWVEQTEVVNTNPADNAKYTTVYATIYYSWRNIAGAWTAPSVLDKDIIVQVYGALPVLTNFYEHYLVGARMTTQVNGRTGQTAYHANEAWNRVGLQLLPASGHLPERILVTFGDMVYCPPGLAAPSAPVTVSITTGTTNTATGNSPGPRPFPNIVTDGHINISIHPNNTSGTDINTNTGNTVTVTMLPTQQEFQQQLYESAMFAWKHSSDSAATTVIPSYTVSATFEKQRFYLEMDNSGAIPSDNAAHSVPGFISGNIYADNDYACLYFNIRTQPVPVFPRPVSLWPGISVSDSIDTAVLKDVISGNNGIQSGHIACMSSAMPAYPDVVVRSFENGQYCINWSNNRLNSQCSFGFWLLAACIGHDESFVFQMPASGAESTDILALSVQNNQLQLYVRSSAGVSVYQFDYNSWSAWTYITVVQYVSDYALYINGSAVTASNHRVASFSTVNDYLYLGEFNGSLAWLQYYDIALTAAQAHQLYKEAIHPVYLSGLNTAHTSIQRLTNSAGAFTYNAGSQSYLVLPDMETKILSQCISVTQDATQPVLRISFTASPADAAGTAAPAMQFIRINTDTAGAMIRTLHTEGTSALLSPHMQYLPEETLQSYSPSSLALLPDMDYMDFNGAFGIYFWELFFYAPYLVAEKLRSSKKYKEAEKWFQYIFDPAAQLSPVGYWPLNREVNGTCPNLVPGLHGTPSHITEMGAQVVPFNYHPRSISRFALNPGSSVIVPYAEKLNPQVFTVAAWVNVTSIPVATLGHTGSAGGYTIINSQDGYKGYHLCVLGVANDSHAIQFAFNLGNDTAHINVYSAPIAHSADWIYVCATFDGNELSLYVNGMPAADSLPMSGIFYRNTRQTLGIGCGSSADRTSWYFDGEIADVVIFDYAMPAAEILCLYTDYKNFGINAGYWNFRPFRRINATSLYHILRGDSWQESFYQPAQYYSASLQMAVYEYDPFDPDTLARLRINPWQKAMFMRYIDNLLNWGDSLFTQDTWESLSDATMRYVLAATLLGRMPVKKQVTDPQPPVNYSQLAAQYDDPQHPVPVFLVEMENSLSTLGPDATLPQQVQSIMDTYFCIPSNKQLLGYWELVADRLYKLRHGLTITGVPNVIPLYAAPIDPMALVQAAVGGSLANAVAGASVPVVPPFRFSYLVAQAKSVASEVSRLGGELLAALEKKDAEYLSQLQAGYQLVIYNINNQIKAAQVNQLQYVGEGLQASYDNAQYVHDTYERWLLNPVGPLESLSLLLSGQAIAMKGVGMGISLLSLALYLMPDIFGLADGGMSPGESVKTSGEMVKELGGMSQEAAQVIGQVAQYTRREMEWDLQQHIAGNQMKEIDAQLKANNFALEAARTEAQLNQVQLEQSQEVYRFLKTKFTNDELYEWMSGQLSTLYTQAYQLAWSLAQSAQAALRYELNIKDTYLNAAAWNTSYQGLLAGDALGLALQQMENAYINGNHRRLEIRKTWSMRQNNPQAFIALISSGHCRFSLDELSYDLDFPGHYNRKIKSISVTIPAVVGPYQNIHATLAQTGNTVCLAPDIDAVKYLLGLSTTTPANAGVLRANWNPNQEIIISTGINDAGVFQVNFSDEQYLPFEGTGAVSSWYLSIPQAANAFPLRSLSDVVITIDYTADDGGSYFASQVTSLPPLVNYKGWQYLSMRQLYSAAWYNFCSNPKDGVYTLPFELTEKMYPANLLQGSVRLGNEAGMIGLMPVFAKNYDGDMPVFSLVDTDLASTHWSADTGLVPLSTNDVPQAVPGAGNPWQILATMPDELLLQGKINAEQLQDIVLVIPFSGTLHW